MLLLVLFCLCFNRINSEKSIWSSGPCKLPEIDINISSSLNGEWYYRANKELYPVVEDTIHPFITVNFHYECLNFILNYNMATKELEIEYSCLKSLLRAPKECQVFVKFGQNNRIIYPATNCPKAPQLKNVMIARTDYLNYLVILGCQEVWTRNQTIVNQDAYLVLSRTAGDLNQEIKNEIQKVFRPSVVFYGVSYRSNLCNCNDFSCEVINSKCYPVRSQNKESKSKMSSLMKYSWIIWLLIGLVLFVLLAILLIKRFSKNRVGVA